MSCHDTLIHLLAGGLGGTAGAIATCPLEVVKTRLQSSVANFNHLQLPSATARISPVITNVNPGLNVCTWTYHSPSSSRISLLTHEITSPKSSLGIWKCIKYIIDTEGACALFKGLKPNLIGVAPSRAIYFCTYSNTKAFWNARLTPDTPLVHIFSAASAGFVSCSATNPIWFVKTRLQLDQRKYGSITTLQCIKEIYNSKGVLGFYKGITASYFGISETIIHFVIYEFLKAKFYERRWNHMYYGNEQKCTRDFIECMFAGAISKTCASCLTYPHEVARTRLRQAGNKYKSFFQTLFLVFQEEGCRGLYRGLATQLIRQIPNTAIMMVTYEVVVYLCSHSFSVPSIKDSDKKEM